MLTFLVRCTRCWCSLKFEWLPAHINATQKKDGHTVLSPIVSELVFQWAWRQHQGPMSPTQFFTALQRLLKHRKNGTKRRYADGPWNVSASCKKWPKRHGRLCGVYLCSSTSLYPFFLRPQPFPLLASKKTELIWAHPWIWANSISNLKETETTFGIMILL